MCTHKSSLASNGWSMSALPAKADSLPQSRNVRCMPMLLKKGSASLERNNRIQTASCLKRNGVGDAYSESMSRF
jgi:hypothetical protein